MEVVFHERRSEPIEKMMKRGWSAPLQVDQFLSEQEINDILSFKDTAPDSILKHSVGTCKMLGVNLYEDHPVVRRIVDERIRPLLPHEFTVRWAWINDLCNPLWIHSDSGSDPNVAPYKIAMMTLDLQPQDASSHLVLFRQRHTGTAAAFLRGTREHDVFPAPHENIKVDGRVTGPMYMGRILQMYEPYDFVENYNDDLPFDRDVYEKYLTHLEYTNLQGLTIERIVNTSRGQLLVWDAGQLHCSAHWSNPRVNRKILLNLFLDHKIK